MIYLNKFILSSYPQIILYKQGPPFESKIEQVNSGYRGALKMTLLEELIHSTAPFADTAGALWGETARYIVAGGAVIATLGALNGWLLIQGQVPLAAAQDKLFPKIFEKKNKLHD